MRGVIDSKEQQIPLAGGFKTILREIYLPDSAPRGSRGYLGGIIMAVNPLEGSWFDSDGRDHFQR